MIEVALYNNGRGEQIVAALSNFRNGNLLYGDIDALRLKPELYWELMATESKELIQTALDYLALPASTASLERAFSMCNNNLFVLKKEKNITEIFDIHQMKLLAVFHS